MVIKEAFQQSIFLSCLSLLLCAIGISMIPSKKIDSSEEKSICFILGEDKNDQQFYSLATEFFLRDSVAKTDQMIKHIRSVEELIMFLNNHKIHQEWDRIELVVHGNVWSGLSLNIMDGGERAYPKDLLRAVIHKQLPLLKCDVIDHQTIINIWGCGIGTNPIMNIALEHCFTDEHGIQGQLNPSKQFVVFKRHAKTGTVRLVQARYWPYFFKRGYRPSEGVILKAMQDQYPESHLDFNSAIKQNKETATFQESFHIPLRWTVVYAQKQDRPTVTEYDDKINWIKSQVGLMTKIKEFGIPLDKYQWTVNKIIHTNEDGEKVPAIKAIGMSTVLCVLEEVETAQLSS